MVTLVSRWYVILPTSYCLPLLHYYFCHFLSLGMTHVFTFPDHLQFHNFTVLDKTFRRPTPTCAHLFQAII